MSRRKDPNLLRNQESPRVFGYDLDRETLLPVKRTIDLSPGDYGCDPIGDGTYRMVPSGDVVDATERDRRMSARNKDRK